jgi:hypothetical protein
VQLEALLEMGAPIALTVQKGKRLCQAKEESPRTVSKTVLSVWNLQAALQHALFVVQAHTTQRRDKRPALFALLAAMSLGKAPQNASTVDLVVLLRQKAALCANSVLVALHPQQEGRQRRAIVPNASQGGLAFLGLYNAAKLHRELTLIWQVPMTLYLALRDAINPMHKVSTARLHHQVTTPKKGQL